MTSVTERRISRARANGAQDHRSDTHTHAVIFRYVGGVTVLYFSTPEEADDACTGPLDA